MYIDKKSIPEHLEIDIKTLTKLLKVINEERDSFEQQVVYNDYVVGLENTYQHHKARGHKWKVTDIHRIYAMDGNKRLMYRVV